MRLSDLFYLNRHDRRILLVLMTVAAGCLLVMWLSDDDFSKDSSITSITSSTSFSSDSSSSRTPSYYQQPVKQPERFVFDPNTADSTQLLRLGLQSWQVMNIYKYRAAGGVYRKKEDFARLYGLTAKQYRELEPYIHISADYQPALTLVKEEKVSNQRDTLRYPVKIGEGENIDLNVADTSLYKKVPGIGSYYSRKIAEYGRRLGGYVSTNQLDEIENFPSEAKKYFSVNASNVHQLNVNRLSLNELKRHPYINYYQAKAIIDHRRLQGPLHSLSELRLLPDFSPEAIKRLEPYVCY